MAIAFELADVLGRYVERAGYTPGQLARLTGLPKATIVNWLEGRVKRPRGVEDLLKLAALLHLSELEAGELLQTAGQPPPAELIELAQKEGNRALLALLAPWLKAATSRPGRVLSPFQAIADLPHFVGREKLLADLKQALLTTGRGSPITSLHGMGGAGKTALAAHLAYQLRPHFPDGVLWSQVSRTDPMATLSTFAQAYSCDVSQYADLNSRSRVVRALLADKRVLLVLDDAQSSEQIEPLLPPSGRCAVLITTRRHDLAVTRGANRFMIGSFDRAAAESLALFGKILGPERAVSGRDTLLAIADLLGHLPLAIDIVAGRLAYEPGWLEANFLARLQQEKGRLLELAYENQSVRSSFNLSYQALEVGLQQFFASLGLFGGCDFSPEAAAFVADLPLNIGEDYLRRLFNLSLVRQSRPGRFRLHLLLADFAREQAQPDSPAFKSWQKGFVAYFVAYVATNSHHYQALELETDTILTALQLAAGQQFDQELVQGLMAYLPFLEARGLYEVAENLLLAGLQAAERVGGAPGRVEMLRYLGRMAERRGQYRPAEHYYEQGLELARLHNHIQGLSHLLRALGVLQARRGDNGLAEAYYQEGLALARQFATSEGVSNLLRGLGVQAFTHGDLFRAEALYEGGLALTSSSDEREKMSGLYWGLGMLAEEQNKLGEAENYLQQALTLARELGYQERVILLLEDLSLIASQQGSYDPAIALLEEGLALARRLDYDWHRNLLANRLGEMYLAQGNWQQAGLFFREALVNARRSHNQEMTGRALFGLAQAISGQGGDPAGAVRLANEGYAILQTLGHGLALEVREWLQGKGKE